jgi:hypothetical protein
MDDNSNLFQVEQQADIGPEMLIARTADDRSALKVQLPLDFVELYLDTLKAGEDPVFYRQIHEDAVRVFR